MFNQKNLPQNFILSYKDKTEKVLKINCIKTVGGDRFIMKQSIFGFLNAFHKGSIELFGIDPLCLENYYKFVNVQNTSGTKDKSL